MDCSACNALGVAITTPSTCSSRSSSSVETSFVPGASLRASSAISGDGSATAATSIAFVLRMAFILWRPIQPTPRKPRRGRTRAGRPGDVPIRIWVTRGSPAP